MDDFKFDPAKSWQEKMSAFRACGIEYVGILSTRTDEDCEAVLECDCAIKTFPIDEVPKLPLPNCNSENCRCILIAKPSPK